jgi:hypothetical protein
MNTIISKFIGLNRFKTGIKTGVSRTNDASQTMNCPGPAGRRSVGCERPPQNLPWPVIHFGDFLFSFFGLLCDSIS